MNPALSRVLAAHDDSPTKLAKALGNGVVRQQVEHWVKVGRVPAAYAPDVERVARALGIQAVCEELCPGVSWSVLREQQAA